MNFTDDELRMIGMAAPVLLRMLRSREERIVTRMIGEFRSGRTEQFTGLAELACVRDQIHEINASLNQLTKGNQNASSRRDDSGAV